MNEIEEKTNANGDAETAPEETESTEDTSVTEDRAPTQDTEEADEKDPDIPRKDREVQRLKKESAKHRVALRATEDQLTQAQNTIRALQTQMIEDQLAGVLKAPKLFWALGNEVASFITEDGQIDRAKVIKAGEEATRSGLAEVSRRKGSINGGYREDGSLTPTTTWAGIR